MISFIYFLLTTITINSMMPALQYLRLRRLKFCHTEEGFGQKRW